jgi:alpha-beta hydrolase superfamily lysophospholipase
MRQSVLACSRFQIGVLAVKLLFLHGWQSTPGGLKPTYLQDHGHEVLNPALPDDDFDAAVRIAQAECDRARPDLVIGSSRGGAVAMNIDSGDIPLVLLCPAWRTWGTATTVKRNTTILHSRGDETVPFVDSVELLRNSGLPDGALIEVGSEHRLADPESLAAMLNVCERAAAHRDSILNHPAISGQYLFPQPRCVDQPFMVDVGDAQLACCRRIIDPNQLTIVHFHGNGEAVADYVPDMADIFADLGLNSLFVEYRQYGGSTGQATLVSMLGDGEAAIKAAGLAPERVIAFGRSIGSLYAIELVHRQEAVAGLILESGIADASERFLTYADLTAAGVAESEVVAEVKRHFNHKKKLSQYQNPLLILHTENDGLIDISHAERNHKWAGSTQKRLVRFPLGNHNTIFGTNAKEYLVAIRTFSNAI